MIRSVLRPALLALAVLLPLSETARTEELRPVSIALDWTLNTNHIGLIVARDLGFYADAGLAAGILPYSDTNSASLLSAGSADFGYVTSLGFLSARAAGAEITALWATMQHENGRLVFNADRPDITRPADLSGMTYAGFGSAWEEALIGQMIRADGGAPVWDTVTLGTGAYEALASGAVDFTLEVSTWEGVNSQLLGRRQKAFVFADYGIPDQQNGYIASRNATLTEDPALIAAFMQATLKGYEWAADHPREAADLLIAAGDFPNPALVHGSMEALEAGNFLRDGDIPVGQIDETRFTAMARFLYDSGVLKSVEGAPLDFPGDLSGWSDQTWRRP